MISMSCCQMDFVSLFACMRTLIVRIGYVANVARVLPIELARKI